MEKRFVTMHARGTFNVKVQPVETTDHPEGTTLGRLSIDKQFQGDIVATSQGQMLSAGGSTKGSGVYVAVERVSGTLNGKTGTFVLHHTGVMTRGAPSLTITVAPDSGSGELVGLAGSMTLVIADGKHSYDLEYTLP
jgi:hypothetical protein